MRRNMRSGMSRRRFLGAAGAGAAGLVGAAMMGSGVSMAASPPPAPKPGITLDAVKARGLLYVAKGENYGFWKDGAPPEGHPAEDLAPNGPWGLEPDIARAICAAIWGPIKMNQFEGVAADSVSRFTYVYDQTADVGIRVCTNTCDRDVGIQIPSEVMGTNVIAGFDFAPTYFYDGADVIYRTDRPVANVIVEGPGTTTEEVLNKAIADYGLGWQVWTSPDDKLIELSFVRGTLQVKNPDYDPDNLPSFCDDPEDPNYDPKICQEYIDDPRNIQIDGMSSDHSALVGVAVDHAPLDFIPRFLSQDVGNLLSKEPLAPFTKEGDSHWSDLVRWVMYALLEAEQIGMTQANANNPEFNTFGQFTIQGNDKVYIYQVLGLAKDWAKNIIRAVGNYGEIYQRNLAEPVWYPRGYNDTYKNGGLHYSPAFR